MICESIASAKSLFLDLSTNFELIFDEYSKIYVLKTKLCNRCHPLETVLIGKENMTGNKVLDICNHTKKSQKWVFGFYCGFKREKQKFKDLIYFEGFIEGFQCAEKIGSKT
jgi:hypothetical protein